MAIISRKYALRLIRAGRARPINGTIRDSLTTANERGESMCIVNRDVYVRRVNAYLWRTDHFRAAPADMERWHGL